MKLFKCHAVIPRADGRGYIIRTYIAIATTWQEARIQIRVHEPRSEFVTVPAETPDPLMIDGRLMTKREFADLRSACEWNEQRLLDGSV
jgi:hypothetical protein